MRHVEPRFEINHRDKYFTKVEKYETDGQETHWHDEYQIEFIASGEGVHLLNSKEFPLKRGQMYVTRLRDFHEMKVTKTATVHRITLPELCMPERFVRSMLKSKANLITQMNDETTAHIENMFLLLESRPEAKSVEEIYMQDCLLNVIIMLFTCEVNENSADDYKPTHVKIMDTLLYIEENCRQKLTLKSVAEHMKMNPSYLNRIMRQHTGFTVYAAVKIARLRYAAKLCRDTDLQCKEICKICCYSGDANFQRDFKKEYGVTPRQYRMAARDGLFDENGRVIEEVYEKRMKERENAKKRSETEQTEE